MDLKPARIIPNDPNAPGEYCLGYLVPLNTTYDELRYAASDLPTQYGSRADLTPHSGLGTISFNRKDDMEVACKAPLLIRGAEMPMCRLITYSPSLYRISMRGLKIPTGSMEEIEMFVRKIDATMSAYGVVQDIVIDILERGGRLFPHPRAEIIIRLNEDKAIPCTATIANTMVTLTAWPYGNRQGGTPTSGSVCSSPEGLEEGEETAKLRKVHSTNKRANHRCSQL
ncbi:hypothetical protein LPJ81_000362 [Coemansia sp. IMI 209127]|nr:hypothetical protein LPJ81_000362 [Coemansia sp. IMI 209127]